jgi:alpha-glucosidase (family GH31 glycosyl hydrolase)
MTYCMGLMADAMTRRQALLQLGSASAGVALAGGIIRGRTSDIVVGGRPVEIGISSLSPATVRIGVLPLAAGQSALVPDDGVLVQPHGGVRAGAGRSADAFAPVKAGSLRVRFTAAPPTIHIETAAGLPVQRLTFDSSAPDMSFLLPKGPLLGLGQGGPQFDRKGSTDRMRSGQGGYQLRTHGARAPIQWLVGTDGWGLFIHRPLGSFDFTGADGKFTPAEPGTPLDVFVVASSDPTVIMSEYARITGHPELPAQWTFGYMQSHRTLSGPDEIMSVARTFREKKLPCDALIYLGTEFTPSGWNTRNGEFEWKKENFPDPKRMIDELHAQHFRVVLHVVIEGRRMSGTVAEPCTPANAVPSGRTPDNQWPPDRNVACYWPYHKPLFDLGVDGWWPDQGDGLDVESRLVRHRMYWEGSQQWRPNERPFALHRNGAAGMQRYGAFLWSGDVQSLWETLRTHVPIAVNTGLSGIPYWGTDIGGFVPTAEYTGELHVRWFQFGAFCPSFRAHGRHWHLKLPWGWNGGDGGPKETNGFAPAPEELQNPRVEPILKKYLELRYRLMPYIYTAARETADTGLPMMRAMWLHHSEDSAAVARGDQFFWGRDILVAPVVEQGAKSRRLYLPKGTWFDFWTSERLDGGREIDRPVDLETTPLYVRAGAVIPMGPLKQYVEERVDSPLTLIVYPGADGASSVYEDDGRSFEYKGAQYTRVTTRWRDTARRLTLALAPGSRMLPPGRRSIEVMLAGQKAGKPITFDGKPVEVRL